MDSTELRNLQTYSNFAVRGDTIKAKCSSTSDNNNNCVAALNDYAPPLSMAVILPNISTVRAVLMAPSRVGVYVYCIGPFLSCPACSCSCSYSCSCSCSYLILMPFSSLLL